jgi:hypothetical protein
MRPRATYAAELKPETLVAFNAYVAAAETRMANDLRASGRFLWIDEFPEPRRQRVEVEIRDGRVEIRQQRPPQQGYPKAAPDGLIHDWVGVIFVPGVQLAQVVQVLQDYNQHCIIYRPSVRRSKLLDQQGEHFRIYLQFYKESPVRASFNAEFDVGYTPLDATRMDSRSISTHIAELKNPNDPDSPEFPVGTGHGYIWRMNNYWRLQQKDGGVYVQVESIALSRSVPTLLAWFVNPLIRRAARETIEDSLNATRRAVLAHVQTIAPTAP